ncbi:hypothetical protein A5788_12650 [Gordonia sp. 852002-50816_SCH5313054-c]|uniref:tyrosine-type recombinase/integrase n=1 Tax=unclassified Gordonia (in: high G+C Gram-positive bacteria) TaxID=2657482 RepID=UPI0007E9555C|nr:MULTISPECIES: site-specific integrase [unclassified Gordonia (in: high G+C Gram-positive bacteria)]OBC10615.1 hypothetical protein A5786_04775 [Gordonia sp. 852002-50816_SCH5313054-a]OBC17350.1 hypothetical protein A5788_12650 [Gordonia sp. 852002-50816_SCH5313054-c]
MTVLEAGAISTTRLDRLKPSDVEALVLAKRAETKVRDGETVRALSDSTIRQVYTVLRAGLDGAVRDGLLAANPCAKVKRPGVGRQEAKHLPSGDVQKVLKAAKASRYFPALVLIASTGLRKGEALGLSWERIDLEAGSLVVRATLGRIGNRLVISEPKTERSRRTVPLSPAVVALLRKHKVSQSEERLRAGDQWQDSGLVFTTEFGGPVDPRNLLRVLEVAATQAGVEKVGVHTLRHSAATAWLEAGVHIKAVADLLGHSSVAITGDIYGHASDDTARSAVAGLSEALGL